MMYTTTKANRTVKSVPIYEGKNLFFSQSADKLASRIHDKNFINLRLKMLSRLGVRSIFLLATPPDGLPEGDTMAILYRLLEEAGFHLDFCDPNLLETRDMEQVFHFCNNMKDWMQKGSGILMCTPENMQKSQYLSCMLLMTASQGKGEFFSLSSIKSLTTSILDRPINLIRDRIIYDYEEYLLRRASSSPSILSVLKPSKKSSVKPLKRNQEVSLGFLESDSKHLSANRKIDDKRRHRKDPAHRRGALMAKNTEKNSKSAEQHSKANGRHEAFRTSRYTIRVKLLTIISSIIFASLGTMIYFTSKYFGAESGIRIQENNLNLAQIVGNRIESEMSRIQYNSALAVKSLRRRGASFLAADFFDNNPNYFYVGAGRLRGSVFQTETALYNDVYLRANRLSRDFIKEGFTKNTKYLRQAADGYSAFNASEGDVPILGVVHKKNGKIILVYIQPNPLLRSFQNSGIVDIIVVNSQSELVLHKDSSLLIEHADFSNNPIVKIMLQSPVQAGQNRYTMDKVDYLGSYQRIGDGGLGVIASVEADVVFAPVRRIQQNNLFILAIVLGIAFIIVFYFAKTITTPIQSLLQGAVMIEKGNYDIRLSPVYRDEIGQLTYSFREMGKGLKEREKIKDAFGKFVNKEIADRAMRGELKLGGERKEAAIFFSDLRGFTAVSESLRPEEVVSFLNAYFTKMVQFISYTHGIVDKYIGDAIMAHWGAVGGKGNSTENAIQASLLMRGAVVEFNQEYKGKYPSVNIGIGINTGPVISGQIGSEERLEYTVIGDAVNLASRIEALNKPFATDILISENSAVFVKGLFKLEAMPSIRVKGKEKPQSIYAVVGRNNDPNCPSDMTEVRTLLGIKPRNRTSGKVHHAAEKEEKFQIMVK